MKRNLRIMVIDDENIVGKRLKPALEKNGDIVETFTDARKALERFSEQHFDIVVSDIRMDDIDGLEVLEQVLVRSDKTKVIIITGYATVEVAQEALMILEIADDPDSAVYEEQEARSSTHMLRLHDVEFNRATILGDGFLSRGDARHVDSCL